MELGHKQKKMPCQSGYLPLESYTQAGTMEKMTKKDFQEIIADAGQVERILTCMEFSKALVSAYDMETLLTAVLERIKVLIPARNWSLLLLDPQSRELYFAVTVGVDQQLLKGVRLKIGEGIAGTVAQTGKPMFIADTSEDPRFSQKVDHITGFDTRSIIALPLLVRGEVVGVFEVVNVEDHDFFREKYLPLLEILGDYVAIAVDNVQNLQKLQARTFIDEVTGFYNTRYLSVKLDKFIADVLSRQNTELSVVFLDIDNFKNVVDTYGHLQGSRVLAEVARVIHGVLGPEDGLVRYGGDEYIVLLPGQSQAQALMLTRRMRRALKEFSFLAAEGRNIKLTASFGIATLPQDARDKETLLLIADRAMFGGKGRGKDCIVMGRNLTPAPEE
uniref:diguanylate cyclase n=1 Tax=Desulfobacca acetoxidans TaxID=60893 RepID=A0A7V6DPI6_9BACT